MEEQDRLRLESFHRLLVLETEVKHPGNGLRVDTSWRLILRLVGEVPQLDNGSKATEL